MRLIAPSSFRGYGFDRAIRRGTTRDGRWLIDLSQVKFIEIYPLVGLACFVDLARERAAPLRFIPPQREYVRTYLARMGFVEMLTHRYEWTKEVLPPVTAHPHEAELVELQRIDSTFGVGQLADVVWARLDGKVHPQILTAIWIGLIEFGDNVIFHARSSGGWFAAQTYGRDTDHERIDLAIGDVGRGMKRSLARHHPEDHAHAIRLALTHGVSGLVDPGRGVGLPDSIENVAGLGGSVRIRSGNASRIVRRSSGGPEAVPYMRGTVVAMSIPCTPRA